MESFTRCPVDPDGLTAGSLQRRKLSAFNAHGFGTPSNLVRHPRDLMHALG
jgi:hypothetical protein